MRKHFMVWGSTAGGLSGLICPGKAAYVSEGRIVIVAASAIDRNDLPPGFQRFLTDAERHAEGIE